MAHALDDHQTQQASTPALALVAAANFFHNAVMRNDLSGRKVQVRHVGAILGCARTQVNEAPSLFLGQFPTTAAGSTRFIDDNRCSRRLLGRR